MTTHEEKLIGRIAVVGRVKDAIVAYEGFEVEPVLRVTLDPAVPQISNWERECYAQDSLDGVATPAGSRCDCAIRVDLRVLFEGISPALLKVDKGLPAPIFGDGIREVCQGSVCQSFIDTCILGQEPTLAERRRARRVDCHDKISLVCKDVRVPPRGPPVIPRSLRAWKILFQHTSRRTRERRRTSMDEKQSRPLLVVAFLPPVRLDDKPVHLLPFGSFEVKVLRGSQRFPDQSFLGEGGDLFGCAIPLEVALGLGQVGFEIVETTDKEDVVRSLERGAREY